MTDLGSAMSFLAERAASSIGAHARLWQCEHCGTEVVAIALEVGHRCPADRSRWQRFVVVEEAEATRG